MRDRIDRLIARERIDSLVGALDGASVRDVRYAANGLVKAASDEKTVLRQTQDFLKQAKPASLHLACQMVPAGYRHDRDAALGLLQRLADASDWTIRDAAAQTCGRLFRADFEPMLESLRPWREHRSANLRRAVVIAAARAAQGNHLERAEPLLRLLEPLLSDQDATIRRNLGPSALGGALLRHYPTSTFEYLIKWSTVNEPAVLWNVAMAFSAPPAAAIARKALIILRKLSLDERRTVWRAVSSAMWKLGRRCPEIVRPELMRWLEDDRRIDVAREALKHI